MSQRPPPDRVEREIAMADAIFAAREHRERIEKLAVQLAAMSDEFAEDFLLQMAADARGTEQQRYSATCFAYEVGVRRRELREDNHRRSKN
jgi:hypothetical protein